MGCLDEHPPPDIAEFRYSVNRLTQALVDLNFSLPVHKFWENKAMKVTIEGQKKIHQFVMKYIKARRSQIDAQDELSSEEAQDKTDFLSSLTHSGKLNLDQKTGIICDMFMAGVDTVSVHRQSIFQVY